MNTTTKAAQYNPWEVADAISDRIIDLMNDEVEKMKTAGDIQPLQLLAGQLLGLVGFMRTAPQLSRPPSFNAVGQAAMDCLNDLMHSQKATEH